jgi:hypothetical protein
MKKAMKFLKRYKGKHPDMKIEKKLVSMADANLLVDSANNSYKEKIKKENEKNNLSKSRRSRVKVV